jgi:hypothetical protein
MLQFELKPVKRQVIPLGPYDIFNGIGVSLSWYEDKDDEEGEVLRFESHEDSKVLYKTYTGTDIKVSVCVPPGGEKTKVTTVFMPPTGAQLEETTELEPAKPYTFKAFQLSADKRPHVMIIKDEHNDELVTLTIEPE